MFFFAKGKRFLTLMLFTFVWSALIGQYDKEQFFLRGRQALIDGKYAQAIEHFNLLARIDTTLHEAFFSGV